MRGGVLLHPRTGQPCSEEALDRARILDDIGDLAAIEAAGWKPRQAALMRDGVPTNAEAMYYQDTKQPFATADLPTITLSTTSLMLWPAAVWTPTAGGAYWWAGKKLSLVVFGKFTSVATPGNFTMELRYGTTDNGGTILATTAALTWLASQANMSWRAEFNVQCRAIGTAGSLQAWGKFECNTAAIAAGQALIPASAPAPVTVDLVAASGLNVQAKRSGSTAETITVVEHILTSLN
jgi:hypothetical protein